MTGLDKIITKINDDSAAKSNAIIANAQKQCDELAAKAEENGNKLAEKIKADAKKECENILSMARSGSEQIEKRAFLEARVEAVGEVLSKLLETLLSLPDDKYFGALLKLAADNAMSGECVVKLSARDISRMPADFENKLSSALAEKNASCEISKEPADIEGGLMLIYGDIEINCSFKAIIEAESDTLKAKINDIIF